MHEEGRFLRHGDSNKHEALAYHLVPIIQDTEAEQGEGSCLRRVQGQVWVPCDHFLVFPLLSCQKSTQNSVVVVMPGALISSQHEASALCFLLPTHAL